MSRRRVRERIVTAATELFEQKGFASTSIQEIAARAEVAPRTVFRYFGSKADLAVAGERGALDALRERVRSQRLEGPLFVVITAIARDHAAYFDREGLVIQAAPYADRPVSRRRLELLHVEYPRHLALDFAECHGAASPTVEDRLAARLLIMLLTEATESTGGVTGKPLDEAVTLVAEKLRAMIM